MTYSAKIHYIAYEDRDFLGAIKRNKNKQMCGGG